MNPNTPYPWAEIYGDNVVPKSPINDRQAKYDRALKISNVKKTTFQTPEKPQSPTAEEVKKVWIAIYSSVIAHSRCRVTAKSHADLAVLDYMDKFNG